MAHASTQHTDTLGMVLAHSSPHTMGVFYLAITITVQCYIVVLIGCRNRRDAKRHQPINSTRVTLLIVAGFLGVVGVALALNYSVSHWLLSINIMVALTSWGYAWSVRRRIRLSGTL